MEAIISDVIWFIVIAGWIFLALGINRNGVVKPDRA